MLLPLLLLTAVVSSATSTSAKTRLLRESVETLRNLKTLGAALPQRESAGEKFSYNSPVLLLLPPSPLNWL